MFTTQKLDKDTLERVRTHGKMGESFDRAIDRVLDEIEALHERLDSHEDELDDLAKNQDVKDEPEESEDS